MTEVYLFLCQVWPGCVGSQLSHGSIWCGYSVQWSLGRKYNGHIRYDEGQGSFLMTLMFLDQGYECGRLLWSFIPNPGGSPPAVASPPAGRRSKSRLRSPRGPASATAFHARRSPRPPLRPVPASGPPSPVRPEAQRPVSPRVSSWVHV